LLTDSTNNDWERGCAGQWRADAVVGGLLRAHFRIPLRRRSWQLRQMVAALMLGAPEGSGPASAWERNGSLILSGAIAGWAESSKTIDRSSTSLDSTQLFNRICFCSVSTKLSLLYVCRLSGDITFVHKPDIETFYTVVHSVAQSGIVVCAMHSVAGCGRRSPGHSAVHSRQIIRLLSVPLVTSTAAHMWEAFWTAFAHVSMNDVNVIDSFGTADTVGVGAQ
jgi:hypothetical protein